ncbi:capsular polysaccharide biosynthesis protein [Clostridia bacterium]|nr:capsular polysaccharide biosynthesis protein [Clostridia bacterium]
MKKQQKRIVIISFAVILIMVAALAAFLMLEDQEERKAASSDTTEHTEDTGRQMPPPNSLKEERNEENQKTPESNTEPEKTPSTDATIDMVFMGDIYLSDYVLNQYKEKGISGVLSEELLTQTKNADLAMANEEFGFSTRGEPQADKQFTFRVNPSYVSVFQDMGLDIVSLANNHSLDFGAEALSDSFATLDQAGILYAGAGDSKERSLRAMKIDANGKKIGILAATRVIPTADWNIDNRKPGLLCTYDGIALCEAITEAKEHFDFVVVYVHWGVEKAEKPQDYQKDLARAYIDAGADLVVGAHPHVLQGIEYYKGKPIVYSLGNFIFYQEIEATVLLHISMEADGNTMLRLIPATASGALTKEAEGEAAKRILAHMRDISFGVTINENGVVAE